MKRIQNENMEEMYKYKLSRRRAMMRNGRHIYFPNVMLFLTWASRKGEAKLSRVSKQSQFCFVTFRCCPFFIHIKRKYSYLHMSNGGEIMVKHLILECHTMWQVNEQKWKGVGRLSDDDMLAKARRIMKKREGKVSWQEFQFWHDFSRCDDKWRCRGSGRRFIRRNSSELIHIVGALVLSPSHITRNIESI